MGPNNPWSPNWRPDPTGGRLASIRLARRGAVLAGALYLVVGAIVLLDDDVPRRAAAIALAMGLPGVALLGAGLAPAAPGSVVDGIVVGIALAVGAPVAAVTSLLIGGFFLGMAIGQDLAGPILRAGMSAAIEAAPIVAIAAAGWVVAIRRLGRGTTGA